MIAARRAIKLTSWTSLQWLLWILQEGFGVDPLSDLAQALNVIWAQDWSALDGEGVVLRLLGEV